MFNPQQQFRVNWPADPVVARAYAEQMTAAGELPDELARELARRLTQSVGPLSVGIKDRALARHVEDLIGRVQAGASGDRRLALSGVLGGIAERLREGG